MADLRLDGDTTVDDLLRTHALCACCKVHPVSHGEHPAVDLGRVKRLAHDDNPAVAHLAAVTMAFASEVEAWKRLAAEAATEHPRRAENCRKNAAVAKGMVDQLAILTQDAKAVSAK